MRPLLALWDAILARLLTSGSAYDTWTPADVLAALDAAGLTLAERGEK